MFMRKIRTEQAISAAMSRKTKLTALEIDWLKGNHEQHSHKYLADRYSVCVDTIKRILMRLNLQYFPGAKYQIKPSPPKWRRPCISCGCTKARAKQQFKCEACHDREADASRVFCDEEELRHRKPKTLELPDFILKGD